MLPLGDDDVEGPPEGSVHRPRRLSVGCLRSAHEPELVRIARLRDEVARLVVDDDRGDSLLPDMALEALPEHLRVLPAVGLGDVGSDRAPERLRRVLSSVAQGGPREARDREKQRDERERHQPRQREDDLRPETGSTRLRHERHATAFVCAGLPRPTVLAGTRQRTLAIA